MGDKQSVGVPGAAQGDTREVREQLVLRAAATLGEDSGGSELARCEAELLLRTLEPSDDESEWAKVFTRMLSEDTKFPKGTQPFVKIIKAFQAELDEEFQPDA